MSRLAHMQPRLSADTRTALDALDVSPLPFLLVACKCDLRPEDSELRVVHERYEIYRTSPESPRSQQMCIALVLRSVISNRGTSIFPIIRSVICGFFDPLYETMELGDCVSLDPLWADQVGRGSLRYPLPLSEPTDRQSPRRTRGDEENSREFRGVQS
jgi:hypothetical protein